MGVWGDGRKQLSSIFEQAAQIDELEDEVKSLRAALGWEQCKMQDGFFGSSTPSSKKPFKNSVEKNGEKAKRARPGHERHGGKGHEEGTADRTEDVFIESKTCPECRQLLMKKGTETKNRPGYAVGPTGEDLFQFIQEILS